MNGQVKPLIEFDDTPSCVEHVDATARGFVEPRLRKKLIPVMSREGVGASGDPTPLFCLVTVAYIESQCLVLYE